MVRATFYPADVGIEVEKNTTILEAARRAGIMLESPCDGTGTCGKCKVKLSSLSRDHIHYEEDDHLTGQEMDSGLRLACHASITGDVVVDLIDQQRNETLQILEHGQTLELALDSFIRKELDSDHSVTRIWAGNELIGTEPGDTRALSYGIVADIGTTTLVVSLVDLGSGQEINHLSSLNPQAIHAQDVLSRIKIASNPEGLALLHQEIIAEINRMMGEISSLSGIGQANIYEVVFSGNTCMLHLAANVNPVSLGRYPYTPRLYGGCHLKAAELGLDIAPFGLVYLPPIISSYVGADITSGLLASQLHRRNESILFIDIGTNGEMVISLNGRLSATSTAAGPAFEGMNITHGMRASNGAIELFAIDADGLVSAKTIGGAKACGICGSGLIDIVGELVDREVINSNGKLANPQAPGLPSPLKERLVSHQGKPAFLVADDIYLSQKDIRQVQLAKGAIRSGVEFLLQSKGITASEIDRVLIAGSFGFHLQAKSLINIGLLPREFEGKIEFIGNSSKSGGQALLLNQAYRGEMEQLVKEVEVVELANHDGFDRMFVQCLAFGGKYSGYRG